MAEILQTTPKTDVPEVDTAPIETGFKQFPFLKTEQAAKEKASEAKIQSEALKTSTEAREKRKVLEEISAKNKVDYETYKKTQLQEPKFEPTQDNAMELGALFSVIATMGVALGGGGKLSSMNALNAMGGMLKGWQSGRKDLFTKEQAIFDKETTRIKTINDKLLKDLEQLQKLSVTDKEARLLLASEISATNPGVIKSLVESGRLDVAADIAKRNSDMILKMKELAAKNAVSGKNTDRYGFGNIIATNLNEAVGSISNIVNLPESSTTGFFQGRNTSGLLFAPLGAMTNQLTTEDVQRYNTEIGNFGKFASRVVSGGRVVPVTVQKDFEDQYKVREGDSPLTVLTRLAQMRQTLERASEVYISSSTTDEGLKDIYRRGLDDIRRSIPFTVNDINNFANDRDKKKTFADMFKEYGLDKGQVAPVATAPSPAAAKPTLKEFLDAAKQKNPTATEAELTEFYNKKYGAK